MAIESIQPYYDWSVACELTERASRLELPFKVVAACGSKAVAIVLDLYSEGVDPAALGIARSYIPDLSADGTRQAYISGKAMHSYNLRDFSFQERFAAEIGDVDSAAQTVEFKGVNLSERKIEGSNFIIIRDVANRNTEFQEGIFSDLVPQDLWLLPSINEKVMFCNHTAATLQIEDPQGRVVTGIIDPSYSTTEPMTLEAWKERQNFPGATILSGGIANDKGEAPLNIHSELMTAADYDRFSRLLASKDIIFDNGLTAAEALRARPDLYETVMREFFNLQQVDDQMNEHPNYRYALHLSKTVITGEEYSLPLDVNVAKRKVTAIVGRLASLFVYQEWLDLTDHALRSRKA